MSGHFVSSSAGGPCAMCGEPATHKVGEEIPNDEPCRDCGATWVYGRDPEPLETPVDVRCPSMYHMAGPAGQRHNLTAYVCCACFTRILGPATSCPVKTKTTVMFEKREWILLQRVHTSNDGTMVGYTVVACGPQGATRLPADVKYIEFPTKELYGDDT